MADGIQISVQGDIEKAFKRFGHINRAELSKATARAINRAMTSGRATAVREIRKMYNIDPKFLKEKIGDKDNRYNALKVWRANPNNLTATLKAYGKPIPLIAFPVTETKKGVEISVIKGQKKSIAHAFITTTKSGHRSVFARGKYAGGKFAFRQSRIKPFPLPDLPITQLTTTSIQTAVVTPTILTAMGIKVRETLDKRMIADIRHILSSGNL